jgi:hypothetical protein
MEAAATAFAIDYAVQGITALGAEDIVVCVDPNVTIAFAGEDAVCEFDDVIGTGRVEGCLNCWKVACAIGFD